MLILMLMSRPDRPSQCCAVDPVCKGAEVEQSDTVVEGEDMYMRYVMPDMECKHCILQMVYCEYVELFPCLFVLLGYGMLPSLPSPHRDRMLIGRSPL